MKNKTEVVGVRMSKDDKQKLQEKAEELGLSLGPYILMNMKIILKGE